MTKIKFCIPGMDAFTPYQSLIRGTGLAASFRTEQTRPDAAELRDYAREYDILVVGIRERFDASVLDENSRVQLICTQTSGTDHIDLDLCRDLGITVVNTAGANAIPCAEYSIGAAISLAKGMCPTAQDTFPRIKGQTADFFGSTALIVGAGQIAQALSRLLQNFSIQQTVWSFSPDRYTDVFPPDVTLTNNLHAALGGVRHVFLCLPYSDRSEGLINAEFLSQIQEPIVFTSISRSGLIADGFFSNGIEQGAFGGVCLDIASPTQQEELAALSNKIITPHIAGDTPVTARNMQEQIAEGIRAFLSNLQ